MSTRDDIERVRVKTRKRFTQFHQALTLDAAKRAILKTPVDTGRARGNWMMEVGKPAEGTAESTDSSGAGTVTAIASRIRAIRFGVRSFIVNNLPYIRKLEYGHSKQAPAGMVRTTVAELKQSAKQIAAQVKRG